MKVILLLLALAFTCAIAQTDTPVNPKTYALKEWTGTTAQGPTWYPATYNTGACVVSSSTTSYTVINATFAQAGTRIVGLVAERGFAQFVSVFLYKDAFSPSTSSGLPNSCANLVRQMDVRKTGDLGFMSINDPTYFEAGPTYFFVVTSTSATQNGRFALTVFASDYMGDTTNGPLWIPSTTGTGACANNTAAGYSNVAVYNFQAKWSGYTDVQVFFSTSSALAYDKYKIYVTLTQGNFSADQMAANPCSIVTAAGAQIITATTGDEIAPIYRYSVTKDVIYTIAVSNAASPLVGTFGIQVIQTRGISASSTTFAQPQRTLPCAANTTATSANFVYFPIAASEHGQQVFIDTYPYPSWVGTSTYFPALAFVYSGSNPTPTTCPTGAPLIVVSPTNTGYKTGSIVFSTKPGQAYTVVFSTDNGGAAPTNSPGLPVYMFAGEWVGNPAAYVPDNSGATGTTTTTATVTGTATTSPQVNATTSTSTTGAGTTGAASTGNGGASTTGANAGTTTDTSSASAIAVSALVLVAIAALL